MTQRRRLAFDATSLLGVRTGVGHVTAGMLDALSADPTLDITAFAISWRGADDLGGLVPDGVRVSRRRFPARLARMLWPRVGRPAAEHWTGPVDVVHAPNFVAPPAHAPVVVTVHDLTFERFPELCTADALTFGEHLRRSIESGATIHAVSDHVADEVRRSYAIDPERVVRVYAGLLPSTSGDADRGRSLAGADRYVLAIGTIEPRKNFPRLVRAFDAIADANPDTALVIAGPDGWGVEAFDEAARSARHRDRIRRLGYVGDDDRRGLLAGAAVLAYPSLYEGFGHPPLEAMQAGVPVVASSAGALPEVLGDAALLPDPTSTDEIADALGEALIDTPLRRTLVARGYQRVARFDWTTTARELAELYERAATSGGRRS